MKRRDPAGAPLGAAGFDGARPEEFLPWLTVLERAYRRTGNPFYVWEAYATARTCGLPTPDWTLGYLDQAAALLLNPLEPTKGAAEIAAALDMDVGVGERAAFADFKSADETWLRYGPPVEMAIANGDKETVAIESVAKEMKTSASTVRRHWKTFQKIFSDS